MKFTKYELHAMIRVFSKDRNLRLVLTYLSVKETIGLPSPNMPAASSKVKDRPLATI